MKKLLFVLAFAFIEGQAYSQMYMVTIGEHLIGGCSSNNEVTLTTISPTGSITHNCVLRYDGANGVAIINQELNSIMSLGYKLINIDYGGDTDEAGVTDGGALNLGVTYYLALPWNSSGLEEVATTINSLSISPNPANEFVNIILTFDLKGESEVIFISEAGYISHKKSIGNISKNEKYNIDISKIPAGKYLLTIVNGKTYTTPKKLIVN